MAKVIWPLFWLLNGEMSWLKWTLLGMSDNDCIFWKWLTGGRWCRNKCGESGDLASVPATCCRRCRALPYTPHLRYLALPAAALPRRKKIRKMYILFDNRYILWKMRWRDCCDMLEMKMLTVAVFRACCINIIYNIMGINNVYSVVVLYYHWLSQY